MLPRPPRPCGRHRLRRGLWADRRGRDRPAHRRPGESPLFLVFPIGGLLQDVGYLLFGLATLRSARWQGWQRWAPLLAAAVRLLAIGIPMLAGITPDGPGLLAELLLGGAWLGVGLAVFTT